jgi:hypothetical protein
MDVFKAYVNFCHLTYYVFVLAIHKFEVNKLQWFVWTHA